MSERTYFSFTRKDRKSKNIKIALSTRNMLTRRYNERWHRNSCVVTSKRRKRKMLLIVIHWHRDQIRSHLKTVNGFRNHFFLFFFVFKVLAALVGNATNQITQSFQLSLESRVSMKAHGMYREKKE